MTCFHHEDRAAVERCTGCAEAFCAHCLIALEDGRHLCSECKVLIFSDRQQLERRLAWLKKQRQAELYQQHASQSEEEPKEQAKSAFWFSIFALLFCSLLWPLAVYKTLYARKRVQQSPAYQGVVFTDVALFLLLGPVFFFVYAVVIAAIGALL